MSKSTGRSLFGTKSGGTVHVIETQVSRNYRRRAIVGFFVVGATVGLLAATVISHYIHPILGLLAGFAIGTVVGGLVAALIFAWPVLRAFWHWLPEILLATGLVYGWQALTTATGVAVSLFVVATVVGVPAVVGPIRRRIAALVWCLIVRHRLRVCFTGFIPTDRKGSLPLILPARPTPAGERAWVWLRPGLSLKDLETEGQMSRIAVTCWANEARVIRASRRFAALLRVDITRRDPLTSTVVSPLPTYVPADIDDPAPVSPAGPTPGLDLPDVPDNKEPAVILIPPRGRKPRNPAPAVTAHGAGPDNSDYA